MRSRALRIATCQPPLRAVRLSCIVPVASSPPVIDRLIGRGVAWRRATVQSMRWANSAHTRQWSTGDCWCVAKAGRRPMVTGLVVLPALGAHARATVALSGSLDCHGRSNPAFGRNRCAVVTQLATVPAVAMPLIDLTALSPSVRCFHLYFLFPKVSSVFSISKGPNFFYFQLPSERLFLFHMSGSWSG